MTKQDFINLLDRMPNDTDVYIMGPDGNHHPDVTLKFSSTDRNILITGMLEISDSWKAIPDGDKVAEGALVNTGGPYTWKVEGGC